MFTTRHYNVLAEATKTVIDRTCNDWYATPAEAIEGFTDALLAVLRANSAHFNQERFIAAAEIEKIREKRRAEWQAPQEDE